MILQKQTPTETPPTYTLRIFERDAVCAMFPVDFVRRKLDLLPRTLATDATEESDA